MEIELLEEPTTALTVTARAALVVGKGHRFVDIAGLRFGRLTALSRYGVSPSGKVMWNCRCDCGKSTIVDGGAMRSGNTKSCGCYNDEATAARFTKHGYEKVNRKSRAYMIWLSMNQRCSNPASSDYAYYGGRGIDVCESWRASFLAFLSDMGDPPIGASLDRKDNNAGYKPSNCRWVTRKEQANNMRGNILLVVNGESFTMSQFGALHNLSHSAVRGRIKRGAREIDGVIFSVSKRS